MNAANGVPPTQIAGLCAALLMLASAAASATSRLEAEAAEKASVSHGKSTVAAVGKVIMVEPSYLPARVTFQLDAGAPAGRCPAGTLLSWRWSDPEKVKGGLSVLLAALSTAKPVAVFFNAATADCDVQYLHLRAGP